MLKAAKHEKVFDEEEHLMGYKKRTCKGKKKEKQRAVNGEFTRQTAEIVTDQSWRSHG